MIGKDWAASSKRNDFVTMNKINGIRFGVAENGNCLDLREYAYRMESQAMLVVGRCFVPAGSGTCVSEGVLRLFYICK